MSKRIPKLQKPLAPLPSSVKIGFRNYTINELKENAFNDEGEALLGRHDWKGVIEINPHFQPEEVVNSFIHEILHGIVDVYNIGIDKEAEELYVRQLANPLTALLKDNPDLLKWIFNVLNDPQP
jgi:hypothetical protein